MMLQLYLRKPGRRVDNGETMTASLCKSVGNVWRERQREKERRDREIYKESVYTCIRNSSNHIVLLRYSNGGTRNKTVPYLIDRNDLPTYSVMMSKAHWKRQIL